MKILNNGQILAIISSLGLLISGAIFYNKAQNIQKYVDENNRLIEHLMLQDSIIKNINKEKEEATPQKSIDTTRLVVNTPIPPFIQHLPGKNDPVLIPCDYEKKQIEELRNASIKSHQDLTTITDYVDKLKDSLRLARIKIVTMENNFRSVMDKNILKTDKYYLFTYPSLVLADEDFTQKYKKLYQMRLKILDSALFTLPYLRKSIGNQDGKLILDPKMVKAIQKKQK